MGLWSIIFSNRITKYLLFQKSCSQLHRLPMQSRCSTVLTNDMNDMRGSEGDRVNSGELSSKVLHCIKVWCDQSQPHSIVCGKALAKVLHRNWWCRRHCYHRCTLWSLSWVSEHTANQLELTRMMPQIFMLYRHQPERGLEVIEVIPVRMYTFISGLISNMNSIKHHGAVTGAWAAVGSHTILRNIFSGPLDQGSSAL